MSKLIFLDPGHGGADPGATYEGVNEKDINLAVALTAGELLTGRGYQVAYSRNDDREVSLVDRAVGANGQQAYCYISIHCNAAANAPTAQGIETWYYKPSSRSARLAKTIQVKAVAVTGAKNRLVRGTESLYVLKYTRMPAALIEMGFLSNKNERALLSTAPYQQSLASAIAEGVDEYMRGEK